MSVDDDSNHTIQANHLSNFVTVCTTKITDIQIDNFKKGLLLYYYIWQEISMRTQKYKK